MGNVAEAALRRHRILSMASLILLTLLAWGWVLTGAGMGMGVTASLSPFPHVATGEMMPMPANFAITFAMWWVMMIAMMLPSAAPTILLYARASNHGGVGRAPPTARFLLGYLIIWGVFSLIAAWVQLTLQRTALLSPMDMASLERWLSALLLAAAGLYQFAPVKNACLSHCRNPAAFIARHARPGWFGALRLGLLHGAYCVGCCWILMALLFVGGVMNIVWIALLTVLIAVEKLLPAGEHVARMVGIGFLLLAALVLV